jgi:hypothetical protein
MSANNNNSTDDNNMGSLDDKFEQETLKSEVEEPPMESEEEQETIAQLKKCQMQCLVRTSTLEGHIKINDTLKTLKSYFFDHRLFNFHQAVKELEEELVKLCASEFRYEICPKASGCQIILFNMNLHREILRALMSSDQSPETLTDNRLIWMLDYVEGLRSSIFVQNINPKSNTQFTNFIESIRKRIYLLYQTYPDRTHIARDDRLFKEGAQLIEFDINKIVGHVIAAGMSRRESMDKWARANEDARKWLRASVALGAKVGGIRTGEPAVIKAIAEGDMTFTTMDMDKYTEYRRIQTQKEEASVEGQLKQMKDSEEVREKIKDMREERHKPDEVTSFFPSSRPKPKPKQRSDED